MNILRRIIDFGYDKFRADIFEITEKDPELAHEEFIRFAGDNLLTLRQVDTRNIPAMQD